jgi:hypothetical protein
LNYFLGSRYLNPEANAGAAFIAIPAIPPALARMLLPTPDSSPPKPDSNPQNIIIIKMIGAAFGNQLDPKALAED